MYTCMSERQGAIFSIDSAFDLGVGIPELLRGLSKMEKRCMGTIIVLV